MKLAIGHYHLNRGGVTRVIENQLLALDSAVSDDETHEALILYGGRSEGWPSHLADRLQRIRLRLLPLPELDYDSEHRQSTGGLESRLARTLEEAGFSPAETIIHLHNHSIGKNAALPRAVWDLAQRGYGLLLQIHDFAEDQRPGNFQLLAEAAGGVLDWHARLYPQARNVHFAVLNGRDRGVLQSVGVPPAQLHFLPNPVLPFESLPDHESARAKLNDLFSVPTDARLVLYPVRGIRRKNVGEALLHSVLAPVGTCVALTLPPLNPAEQTYYEQWKASARRWQPPFRFDVGAPGGLSFAENLAASDVLLTTSVAEGFGMVYLEAWLADRPLMGRDLPEITRDFTEAGLDLTRLSSRFEIPTDWLDLPRLRQALLDAYRTTLAAYSRPEPRDLSDRVDARLRDQTIDFGDLDESFQAAVIGRVVSEPSAGRELLAANPWIDASSPDELVRANAEVVRREFSLEPSGSRLVAVYESILNSPRDQGIKPLDRPGAIVDRFLEFERFRLLRN
jgi:glycosyltransferase involved in cell wall biosynthesis